MRVNVLAVIVSAVILMGCTITRSPQLYPNNDIARTTGPLTATIVGHGTLNGTATMPMPDGEILNGRYSIAMGGSTGFGSLYGSVYGTDGNATGSAFASNMSFSNSGQGMLDMIGPKGTTAHCEFLNNNLTGHGNGACQISNGAIYRMQY